MQESPEILVNLPASSDSRPLPSQGVYGISVAAELAGLAPQNLRRYEACGLLTPARSEGGTRRYSHNDVDRIIEIGRLLHAGLNLAGIAMVLRLQDANGALQAQLEEQDSRAVAASMSSQTGDGVLCPRSAPLGEIGVPHADGGNEDTE